MATIQPRRFQTAEATETGWFRDSMWYGQGLTVGRSEYEQVVDEPGVVAKRI